MRFNNYLTEDIVSKALALEEPKVGGDYAPEKAKRYVELINQALEAMRKRDESEANDAIVQDLRDKKKKWSNINKSTKPTKTKQEEPPPEQEEPPPEQEEPEQQQEPPPAKENWEKLFKKMI